MKTGDIDENGKTIIILTNSSMTEFRNCRYKYWLNYVKLFTPKVAAPALEDGTVWHDALEKHYLKEKPSVILRGIREDYDALMTDSKVRLNDRMREDYFNRMYMLMGMFTGYTAHYGNDLDQWRFVWPKTGKSTLEIKFHIKLFEDDNYVVYNEGKVDGLGYHIKKKEWWVWEHKSASRIDQAYVEKLPMDGQCLNYMWAGDQILSSNGVKQKVKGVIYNVTKKSMLRKHKATKTKKAETKKDYVKRVQLDYKKRPDFYFMRKPVKFDPRQLQNYETDIKRLAKNIIQAIEHPKGHMYKNYSQCTAYGKCSYMSMCVTCSLKGPHMKYYYIRDTQHQELKEENNVK